LKLSDLGLRFGFLRLFGTANMRLIGPLIADQGTKHWKGYAFALAMTMIVAWTTTMSAWIMRDVINEIFVAKKLAAVWMIGGAIVAIYAAKGFAAYGQTAVLSRVANNIVAEVRRCIFDKMLAMSLGYYSVRHSTEFIARQAFISLMARRSAYYHLHQTQFAREAAHVSTVAG
jgi:ATP-binding cassette subfamily B protein